jgi:hypothetical protein
LQKEHRLRTFENMVLRVIFGAKRDEVTGECRKLHNGELYDLYCSPNILSGDQIEKNDWVEHVARMGENRGDKGFWWGDMSARDNCENLIVCGNIIFKRIFKK